MIEYIVDRNNAGVLTLYKGDFQSSDSAVYTIQQGTPHGNDSYYLRAYLTSDIAYTVMPDNVHPNNYLVYRGSSPMYGQPIDYYLQSYGGEIIVRSGDSIDGNQIFRVRSGSSHAYVVEPIGGFNSGSSRSSAYPEVEGNAYVIIFQVILFIAGIIGFIAAMFMIHKLVRTSFAFGLILDVVVFAAIGAGLYKGFRHNSSFINPGLFIGAIIGLILDLAAR